MSIHYIKYMSFLIISGSRDASSGSIKEQADTAEGLYIMHPIYIYMLLPF